MSIEISVRGGGPISPAEWDAIQALPKEELPPLTPGQQQAARQMRIPEAEYARTVLASKRGAENSLEKAQRFARFLNESIKKRMAGAALVRVALDTLQGKFEVEAQVEGRFFRFRVTEKLVDDLFESGSELAESRLNRVLDLAFRNATMKVVRRQVEVVLSEDGQTALRLAGLELPETALTGFFVEDADEMGIWVRVTRGDETHFLLVRWEYVLSLDLLPEEPRRIGLSA